MMELSQMVKTAEKITVNDPVNNPEQRAIIDQVLNENRHKPGATMVVLSELQNKIGFISDAMQIYVAKQLEVPVSTVHGVVTFYSFFTTTPRGKHTIKFCMGTACYVGGVPQLIEKAKQVLGINLGETTADGNITLEACRCVGACSQAPVIVVDDDVMGRFPAKKIPQIFKNLQE
jgi:NADH:ubiquinone oxidoreductase subunit E